MKTLTHEQAAAGYRVHPNGRVIVPPVKTPEEAARFCYGMGARDPSLVAAQYYQTVAGLRRELEKVRALADAGKRHAGAPASAWVPWIADALRVHVEYATAVPAALARLIEGGQ
jgi:hypothetical protein